MTTIWIKPEYC